MAGNYIGAALKVLTAACILAGMTACSMSEPTSVTSERAYVQSDIYAVEIPSSMLSGDYVSAIVEDYRSYGNGDIEIISVYDPSSSSDASTRATKQLAKVAGAFQAAHISALDAGILPVKDAGKDGKVLITYVRSMAAAPKDCEMMPGVNGAEFAAIRDYKMGCSVETLIARQVARPDDLAGKEPNMGLTDGRRASNVLWVHKGGATQGLLSGETTQ